MDRTAEASTSGSAAPQLPDADRVVAALKASGELERLRTAAVEALERDEWLRNKIKDKVAGSRALHEHQGDRGIKSLLPRVQEELASKLSQDAVDALWHVLASKRSPVSAAIDDAARAVLCQLHTEELQAGGAAQRQRPSAQ